MGKEVQAEGRHEGRMLMVLRALSAADGGVRLPGSALWLPLTVAGLGVKAFHRGHTTVRGNDLVRYRSSWKGHVKGGKGSFEGSRPVIRGEYWAKLREAGKQIDSRVKGSSQ